MKLRIALVGELCDDRKVLSQMDILLGQITGHLSKDTSDMKTEMVVAPVYTGAVWNTWIGLHDFSTCSINMRNDRPFNPECNSTIWLDTSIRTLIGENICNKVDIILAVWDENVSELSGATWELLNMAYKRKIPCIWLSSKSFNTYCLRESYYSDYSSKYLEDVMFPLSDAQLEPSPVSPEKGLVKFWRRVRSKFFDKKKAKMNVFSNVSDNMLKDDFDVESETVIDKSIYQQLLGKFNKFDSDAIEYNERFQSLVYARSILPLITTAFLAIGFYAETLFGKTWSWLFPENSAFFSDFALILAGAGLIVHGILNLYVYRLSVSKNVENWKNNFVNSRFTAEVLRILTHLAPYGFSINLREICTDNKKLLNCFLHINDSVEEKDYKIDSNTVKTLLKHLDEMIEDQLAYHKKSSERYEKIVSSLAKWSKTVSYIAFAVVIIRALLQYVLSLSPISDWNGFDINSWIRSFANCAALLLPAWASFFSTKIMQNNFNYNLANHNNMAEKLTAMKNKLEYSMNQESIQIEIISSLVDEIVEIMILEDSSEWKHQYMNTTIKPL